MFSSLSCRTNESGSLSAFPLRKAIAALLSIFPLPAVAEKSLEERVQAVDACVQQKVKVAASSRSGLALARPSDVSIFVAERTSAELRFDVAQGKWVGRVLSQETDSYCDESFEAFAKKMSEVADSKRRGGDSLAKLGSISIASESILVSTYQNLFGKHHKGHADISMDSAKKDAWSSDAMELFAASSLAPDLYRWEAIHYHAHTVDVRGLTPAQRDEALKNSQEKVVTLLNELLRRSRLNLESSNFSLAVAYLGFAAHVVQDLVFHRGMTLAQHSGLAYALNKDPDDVSNVAGKRRYDEAVRKTDWMLGLMAKSVTEQQWSKLRSWKKSAGDEPRSIIMRAWEQAGVSPKEDIGAGSLLSYMTLAGEYQSGARDLGELSPDQCEASSRIICWQVDPVLGRVRVP
jgi:hypothetical protein